MFLHILLGLFLGLPLGTGLGVLIMALLAMAKQCDTVMMGSEG